MKNQRTKEILRFFKFALFSVSAGLVEMAVFTLLNELSGWSYWPCYLIALVASVVWNFTLNRKFTFKSAANVPVAMLKVLAYYAVFTPLSTLLGHWLADVLLWNEYSARFSFDLAPVAGKTCHGVCFILTRAHTEAVRLLSPNDSLYEYFFRLAENFF